MERKVLALATCLLTLGRTMSITDGVNEDTLKFGTRLRKLSTEYHVPHSAVPKNIPVANMPSYKNAVSFASMKTVQNISSRIPPRTEKLKSKPVHSTDRISMNSRTQNNQFLSTSPDDNRNSLRTAERNDGNAQSLINLPNFQLNRIEPFWPFSNVTSTFLVNNLKLDDGQNNKFPHVNLPDRFKDTTFFFSHVGPNSFEYRAQFHHNQESYHQPKEFNPFVNEFPEFPKFPILNFPDPTFPDPPQILQQKPKFPALPEFKQFPFTPFFPPAKHISPLPHEGPIDVNFPQNINGFDEPRNGHNKRNAILDDLSIKYPKIFKFNDERINIEDFEREKKMLMKLKALDSNQISEPENVQRSQLLILHGGIFTVKEPPLYHRKVIRKRRQRLRNNKVGNY